VIELERELIEKMPGGLPHGGFFATMGYEKIHTFLSVSDR
jgi:hypothetical protein